MRGCVQLHWTFGDSMRLPTSWWVIHNYMCRAECSAVLYQKWHDSHAPPPYSTQSCPWAAFVSLGEKSSQREMYCQCGRGEIKNGRSTKRHEDWQILKLLITGKKVLIGVLHQMESTWKGTEVETCKMSTQFFVNKFQGFGVPPQTLIFLQFDLFYFQI